MAGFRPAMSTVRAANRNTLLQTTGHDQTTLRARGIAVEPDGTRLLAQVVGRRRSVTVLPDAESQPLTDLVVISPRS